MNIPTVVEARFAEEGDIALLSFSWQGRALPITSMGRHWEENGAAHFLVMTPGEQIFELTFDRASGRWAVVSAAEPRFTA